MHSKIVPVFGYPFFNYTTIELVNKLLDNIENKKGLTQIVTVNMDFIARAKKDQELREIIRSADIVTADGMPIIWVSKLFKKPLKERVTGSDLTPLLIHEAHKKDYPIFFLGGSEKENSLAVKNIKKQYEGIKVGAFAPDYKPLLIMENEEILEAIKEIRPKILFLSLGSKAEKWARMESKELEELGVKVVIGVGATIKFLAGTVKRAPVWMQKSGLEWFYRLLAEPKHLYKRYTKDLYVLLGELVKEIYRSSEEEVNELLYNRKVFRHNIIHNVAVDTNGTIKLVLKNNIQVHHLHKYKKYIEKIIEDDNFNNIEFDLLRVSFLDSAALGYLLKIHNRMKEKGKTLKILRVSPQLYRLFKFREIDTFMNIDFYIERKPAELADKFCLHYREVKVFQRKSYFFIKRTIDIVGAIIGLMISIPVIIITAIGIKIEDGGSIFFKQVRVGHRGEPFYMYKIRSMVKDAEVLKKSLEKNAEVNVKIFKMKNDPRITRIGKFIRATSIDELPQFYNVLVGHMSLVGPRPAIDYEVGQYTYRECGRVVHVKPGITGLAQIFERHNGKLSFEEQIKLDMEYISDRTVFYDINLLFKTAWAVIKGRGA